MSVKDVKPKKKKKERKSKPQKERVEKWLPESRGWDKWREIDKRIQTFNYKINEL